MSIKIQSNRRLLVENEFRSTYDFIRSDIKLSAVVNKKTGKQILLMEKINPKTLEVEFSDEINCIHAAIVDLTVDKLEKNLNESNFNRETINIRSSEDLLEIKLSPEEKFKAFNSWVAGIAEAGINALRIQSEIENEGKLIIPITRPLMKFLTRIDTGIMLEYIADIKKACVHESIRHEACLIANLAPILSFIINEDISEEKEERILKAFFAINPPISLFSHESEFKEVLIHPAAIEMLQFSKFFSDNEEIKRIIIKNPEIAKLSDFSKFLSYSTEPNSYIRIEAAKNLNSTNFEEFKNFLSVQTEPDLRVRKAAANNPNAVKFEEYKNFLSFKTEPDDGVRKMAARNPEAGKIKEFFQFFSFLTEPNHEIRKIATQNPHALEFKEFKNLLHEKSEPILEVREIALKKTGKQFKIDGLVTKEDFREYFRLKNQLEDLRSDFEGDNEELIKEIADLEKILLPPKVKLDNEILRELDRLKKMNISKNKEEPR